MTSRTIIVVLSSTIWLWSLTDVIWMSFRLMVESHNLHMSSDIVQAGFQTSKWFTKRSLIMSRHVYKPKEHVLKHVAVFRVQRYCTLVTLNKWKEISKTAVSPSRLFLTKNYTPTINFGLVHAILWFYHPGKNQVRNTFWDIDRTSASLTQDPAQSAKTVFFYK